jgi:hypothetical protein
MAGIVADSLTGILHAMVTCLFVVSRSFFHKGSYMSLQVKVQRFQSGKRGGHPGGPPLPYHRSRYVLLKTPRTERLRWTGSSSYTYHIHGLTANSFSRSDKTSQYKLSVSRCGKTWGPISHQPFFPHN